MPHRAPTLVGEFVVKLQTETLLGVELGVDSRHFPRTWGWVGVVSCSSMRGYSSAMRTLASADTKHSYFRSAHFGV
jgi:hypothetical protein